MTAWLSVYCQHTLHHSYWYCFWGWLHSHSCYTFYVTAAAVWIWHGVSRKRLDCIVRLLDRYAVVCAPVALCFCCGPAHLCHSFCIVLGLFVGVSSFSVVRISRVYDHWKKGIENRIIRWSVCTFIHVLYYWWSHFAKDQTTATTKLTNKQAARKKEKKS